MSKSRRRSDLAAEWLANAMRATRPGTSLSLRLNLPTQARTVVRRLSDDHDIHHARADGYLVRLTTPPPRPSRKLEPCET